jgi:hypothetical protein
MAGCKHPSIQNQKFWHIKAITGVGALGMTTVGVVTERSGLTRRRAGASHATRVGTAVVSYDYVDDGAVRLMGGGRAYDKLAASREAGRGWSREVVGGERAGRLISSRRAAREAPLISSEIDRLVVDLCARTSGWA